MYDKERSSLGKDALMRIRVVGEPCPFPNKIMVTRDKKGRTLKFPRMVDNDFRTRKNKITGEPEKWDKGYKRKWMDHVAASVEKFFFDNNLEPFPKNHPVAFGYFFFITKSKSCNLEFPSQDPDYDNLEYAINNALKTTAKTKKKVRILGKHPEGVLFFDDNQPVWRIEPDGMVWANEFNPPGVLISCQSAYEYRDQINKWVTQKQEVLL